MIKALATTLMAGALTGLCAAVTVTAPAAAAVAGSPVPTFARPVAYVRAGDVYLSSGRGEHRITHDGGYRRPRWSPDHRRIAVLRAGQLWVMDADGQHRRLVTDRPAAGAAWSPDGRWLAFASRACLGGPGVYRIPAAGGTPQVLFPALCRDEPLPPVAAVTTVPGTLIQRLRLDDAVAWSPDGSQLAFRGGDCESVVDDCLTLGDLATGAERTLAAYGGGGREGSGFAVVPAFRPDGKALSWTAHRAADPDAGQPATLGLVELDLSAGTSRALGVDQDRELTYVNGRYALLTGLRAGGSWVFRLDLRTGARVPFHAGSQPSA